MIFCPNCGNTIDKTDNYCKYCGWDMKISVEPEIESVKYELILNDYYKSLTNIRVIKL